MRPLVSLLSLGILATSIHAGDSVSGKFTGEGKPSKLAFASSRKDETFKDKPYIMLYFTEKDPHGSTKFANGDFGCALTISIENDGKIAGCQVTHSGFTKGGFWTANNIKMTEFKKAGGRLTGKISTGGEQTTLNKKWDVEITFDVKAP
ncbi:MAG TPA: hypothetical protein VHR66_07175 [Gemmataceae bacterium]|jgi:hypothetical protein|nr:hypothetical protein [Gemmataceae bacterium]